MGLVRSITKYRALCAAIGCAVALSSPMPAESRSACGDFYRVKQGDTLMTITIENLGHRRYREVFRANRDILPTPGQLETGQLLYIPCAGRGPQDRAAALAEAGRKPTDRDNLGDRIAVSAETAIFNAVTIDQEPQPAIEKPQHAAKRFLLLTSSGFAPLSGEELPGGGLASVLMQHALAASDGGFISKLAFVEDRKAHLRTLMPSGAFALGFPWPKPNCGARALSAESQHLCADYLFSKPLYEIEMALIGRAEGAASATLATASLRLCRPVGFPPTEWEVMAGRPEIVIAADADACIALVRQGDVDFVTLPAASARAYTGAGDLVDQTALLPPEARHFPVHAIAWRGAPDADQAIAYLNQGLRQLQSSGEWFQIVSDYLSDYSFRSASAQASN